MGWEIEWLLAEVRWDHLLSRRPMELRHLRYFAAVAHEGHFGRAAVKLNVAQPALSRTIQALEKELGFELFERLPRGVRLGDAGRRYLVEVERILTDLDTASRVAREVADQEKKMVWIGHPILFESHEKALSALLKRFYRASPDAVVQLQLLSSLEQQNAIRDRMIDFGFGHVCGSPLAGLRKTRVVDDPFRGARVGQGHRLAKVQRRTFAELRNEPLLIFRRTRNPQMFDFIVQHLRQVGFMGEIVQHAESAAWNWKIRPQDSGWMLCTELELKTEIEGTVSFPLSEIDIPFGLDFLWGENDHSQVMQRFLSLFNCHSSIGPGS